MRLFFGLSLPDEIRAEAARCALDAQQTIPGRYSPMENYHITLAFIGDVPQERLPDAQAVLSKTIARFPAPLITLDRPGHFGRAQNGILILHAKAKPALEPLHDALVKNLNAAALPADSGPFSPHITLARHADVTAGFPPAPAPLSFTADTAHVFLSARNKQGILVYTPIVGAGFAPSDLHTP